MTVTKYFRAHEAAIFARASIYRKEAMVTRREAIAYLLRSVYTDKANLARGPK